jgi:hypothetical protein
LCGQHEAGEGLGHHPKPGDDRTQDPVLRPVIAPSHAATLIAGELEELFRLPVGELRSPA